MLHVYVMAAALFFNPITGEEKLATGDTSSPIACAQVLNEHQTVETDEGTFYMIKAECHGVYVDDSGNVVSYDGDGNE